MGDKPAEHPKAEKGQENNFPAPLPRPEGSQGSSADNDDTVDGDFRVIQETIGRLIRQELRQELVVVRQEIRSEHHIGPLPHEKTLEAYEKIVPGSAKMIFDNFEEQGRHRRTMEAYALTRGNHRSIAGLACGLIVTLSFLLISYLLIKGGHGIEGTVLGSVDLVGLVAVFVYGSRALKEERVQKTRLMLGKDEPINAGSTEKRD